MKRKADEQTVELGAFAVGRVRALVRVREFSDKPHARRYWRSADMKPQAVLIDRQGEVQRIDLPREPSSLLPLLAPVAMYIAARGILRRRRR